jgi:hypothetical protein
MASSRPKLFSFATKSFCENSGFSTPNLFFCVLIESVLNSMAASSASMPSSNSKSLSERNRHVGLV